MKEEKGISAEMPDFELAIQSLNREREFENQPPVLKSLFEETLRNFPIKKLRPVNKNLDFDSFLDLKIDYYNYLLTTGFSRKFADCYPADANADKKEIERTVTKNIWSEKMHGEMVMQLYNLSGIFGKVIDELAFKNNIGLAANVKMLWGRGLTKKVLFELQPWVILKLNTFKELTDRI